MKAAIRNAGFEFPCRKITVNLAPADLRKDGSGLDLAIAVGILAASEQIDMRQSQDTVVIGELSLQGGLRPIFGILSIVTHLRDSGFSKIIVPVENFQEAALIEGMVVYPARSLQETVSYLQGEMFCPELPPKVLNPKKIMFNDDFSDVQGQFAAKRALEVSAAGGHNLMMVGSPGSGKTMLARRIPTILPDMSPSEALEVTKIYSVSGLLKNQGQLMSERPFRSPHHTISAAAMVGGGRIPKPGEVTLSHNGVLFLDELPEYSSSLLEMLRQPIEDGFVTIARVNAVLTYPARFMMIASMNPCPCGFLGDINRSCVCTTMDIKKYMRRISGPLLDRIDIQIPVPMLKYEEIESNTSSEKSEAIRNRVTEARSKQWERFAKSNVYCNAQMSHRQIEMHCEMAVGARKLLKEVFIRMSLSARAHDRIIKVAQTIADLSHTDIISEFAIAEAIQLRVAIQGNS